MRPDLDWERVEALFHRVMEAPPGQRDGLVGAPEIEADLRAQVKRMVRAAELATGFMATAAEAPVAVFEPSLEIGAKIGVWRVERCLGAGGMGEVYRVARVDGGFEQAAALKMMRGGHGDEIDVARFHRERQILARLEHPNIARLIDGGDSAGRHFMVVELIDGETITDHVSRCGLSLPARLKLFLQLCAALSHAHARLVLHRDIKPQNVLVTAPGEIKLIDFGVAYSLDDQDHDRGAPLTVAYAAPEQLAGTQVGAATDIYALGLLLHEVLTGEAPKVGKVSLAGEHLDGDLRAILGKALELSPEARYGSADALAEELTRYLTRQPVEARGGGRLYRLGRLISRYRLAALAFLLFVLSLAGGWWLSASSAERARAEAARAEAALEVARAARSEQAFEARTLGGYRRSLQAIYGQLDGGSDGSPKAGGLEELDAERIDRRLLALAEVAKGDLAAGSLQDGYLLYSIGQHFMHRFDFEKAAEVLRVFLDIDMADRDLSLEARSDLARAWNEMGEVGKAGALARSLLEERTARGLAPDLGSVQDAAVLSSVSGDPADQEAAIREIRRVIARLERHMGRQMEKVEMDSGQMGPEQDLGDLSWLYNQLGTTLLSRGDFAGAADAFDREFELSRRQSEDSLDAVVGATNWAQMMIYIRHEGARALELLPEYLAMNESLHGDSRTSGFIHGLIAEAALIEGRFEIAAAASTRAAARLEGDLDYRDGWSVAVTEMGAKAAARRGDLAVARELIESAASTLSAEEPESSQTELSRALCRHRFSRLYVEACDGVAGTRGRLNRLVERCRSVGDAGDLEPGLRLAAKQVEEAMATSAR